jgi:hypothetical protein
MLVTVFLATGRVYPEMRGLTLGACVGRLALLRSRTLQDEPKLVPLIGQWAYRCVPEIPVTTIGANK